MGDDAEHVVTEVSEGLLAVEVDTATLRPIPGGTAKHGVALDLPKVRLTGIGTPLQGRKVVRQKLTGRAIFSASSSSPAATWGAGAAGAAEDSLSSEIAPSSG